MVTNIKEGKTKKCEQYWPAESGSAQSYGPFSVTVLEQHTFADYTIRTIQLVVNILLMSCLEFLYLKKRFIFECMTFIKLGFQLELR